jgi:hypothetical protein
MLFLCEQSHADQYLNAETQGAGISSGVSAPIV